MTSMPLVTAPIGIPREDAAALLAKHKIEKLPIVDGEGRLSGLITVKDFVKTEQYPRATKDEEGRLRVAAGVGFFGDAWTRAMALVDAGVDIVVVDTAHGHAQAMLSMIHRLKTDPAARGVEVIGGNVATRAGAQALVDAGADAVKVGVGPGSICTTRVVAGVGVPQITAIYEASKATRPGRASRSSATAACSTPATSPRRSSPARTRSCSAPCSRAARRAPATSCSSTASSSRTTAAWARSARWRRGAGCPYSKDRYFQADVASDENLVPEGIEGQVPYRGPLRAVAHQLVGGLHQSMFYVGARTIPELQARGQFVRITAAGLKESHPHDIQMTVEAPNYGSR